MENPTATVSSSISPSISPSPAVSASGTPTVISISPSLSATVSSLPTATPSAQTGGNSLNPCPKNSQFMTLCNLKISQIGPYISSIVTLILVIAVIISLFSLLWGGIRWIIAGGDKGKVAAARSGIFAAVIGLILVFLAYFILNTVLGMFGLSLTKLTLPTIPFNL